MRRTVLTISLLVAAFVNAAYSRPASAQDDDRLLASMRKAGQVKVAMSAAPPWAYVSPTGEAKGYAVELMNMALKGMGLPALTPVLTSASGFIPGLQARQFDMIAPTIPVSEDRCKVVVFSGPTFVMRNALYVLPGNPKKLTSFAQIAQRPDIKVGVITGASQEAFALRQGVKPEQLVRVTDIQAGVATVKGGRADSFVVGEFSIPHPAEKGLEVVVDEQSPVNGYALAFRKEDVRFRDAFNEQLDLLRKGGAIKALLAKYGVTNGDAVSRIYRANDLVPSCE